MKRIRMPKKIEKISTYWTKEAPFFSEFTYRFYYYEMKPGEMEIPTMGVKVENAKLHLYYDKEFLDKISLKELEFTLIHEIMHIVSLHQNRFNNVVPEENRQEYSLHWNIAADMIINTSILQNTTIANKKIKPLKGIVTLDQAYKKGYKGKPITEPLFKWLIREYPKKKKNIYIVSLSNSKLSTVDDHSFMKKAELKDIDQKFIEDVIKNAVMRGWGSTRGDLVDEINEIAKGKTLNWKQLLRKYANSWAYGKGALKYRTWSRRNRRQLPLPGYKRPHNKIAVAIDTSGSIDQEQFEAFFREVEFITRDINNFTVLECDTVVQQVSHYKRGDYKKMKLLGRGGTSFQPVFDWLKEHKQTDVLLIYFTDLFASHDINNYGIRTIWCTTNGERMPSHLGPTINISGENDDA